MTIDKTILQHLLYDEDFTRRVLPYLDPEYFRDQSDRVIFELAAKFVTKYNKCPTVEAIRIDLDRTTNLHNNTVIDVKQSLEAFKTAIDGTVGEQWLIDATERFCQEQAIYRAVAIGASIVDGKSKLDAGILPKMLQDALSVCFDKKIGHDYLNEAEERWERYHNVTRKIPFDLEDLNLITKGGVSRKTLNVLAAPVNTGKTLCMCHMASSHLAAGYNVLYISLEMEDIEIAKRIDANLLDVDINWLIELPKDKYMAKINKMKKLTKGRLVIKEFPTKSAHVGNFRFILNELKLKQNFVPDVIYIDYINNTKDQQGGKDLYTQVKNVTEDLRGLAIEFDVAMISATQVNREGMKSSDLEMTDTAESMGLPQTVDLMLGILKSVDLPDQFYFKILKTRYGSSEEHNKFMIGVDRSKQRLYTVSKAASQGLTSNRPKSSPVPSGNVVNSKPKNTLFDDVS